jgi:hypothetical protein
LVSIPSLIPTFIPRCTAFRGLVVEGGAAADDRINRVLDGMCQLAGPAAKTQPELAQAIRALTTARIRFALFTRTGDLSTADLSARRILLAKILARTTAPAGPIAPLLIHEAYHLSQGLPVTASQEFHARVAEFAACTALFDEAHYPRGCEDARAVVRLGEARAVELFVRAGYLR